MLETHARSPVCCGDPSLCDLSVRWDDEVGGRWRRVRPVMFPVLEPLTFEPPDAIQELHTTVALEGIGSLPLRSGDDGNGGLARVRRSHVRASDWSDPALCSEITTIGAQVRLCTSLRTHSIFRQHGNDRPKTAHTPTPALPYPSLLRGCLRGDSQAAVGECNLLNAVTMRNRCVR